MRNGLLTGIALAALVAMGACSPGDGNGNTDLTIVDKQAGDPKWTPFVDDFIAGWFRLDPGFAVYQGKHEFDGQLPDWSDAGLKKQAAFLHQAIEKAQQFTPETLSPEQRFERDYLVQVAEGKLFWLEDADSPHTNPAYYVGGGLDPNVYIARNYADKPTRMKAMIAFFGQVPSAAEAIRANLKTPMPRSFIDYGVAGFNGLGDFYAGDARQAFADVDDKRLQQQFADASARAAKAMHDLGAWLASQKASANTGFALGPERFSKMLRATEGVDIPLDQLEAIGKADLAKNQVALKQACAQFAPGATIVACTAKMKANKPPEGPVAAARKQIPELRDFVVSHDIVSIPGTEEAKVEESPPYNRQNSAYIDPPGPFDKGIPSVYYISPPDPAWPKQVQLDFIPAKDDLLFTTIHEIMPGHFVQFLHANRSPSIFGQLFVGYAYAEGWAHYAEQMMWDAGYSNGDPEVHIGQLSNALLRDCRFQSAIGLHTKGMTQDQSRKLFVDECYQDEGTARQQAARGTYDPAYLNYTLGKLMILRLRDDWTASRGGRKAWKAFHDQFLSYGGPPIPLVRQAMMDEAEPKALFPGQ
ncbi:DUF885 domain-containing protein [Hephaestia sp. GCM10023244]|uniref:DUF885 domain-containing protein n=1 Tax=unclassified Hephaestia TaxID=2631281 RepID=UPI00207728F9|nr:DUF885 domain-containing protein [Hephaestia sp. MAHUQ-44]MCM8732104.1 DUF885 domain-containing protein [Hephaestia sp. MAHUQ-44]